MASRTWRLARSTATIIAALGFFCPSISSVADRTSMLLIRHICVRLFVCVCVCVCACLAALATHDASVKVPAT